MRVSLFEHALRAFTNLICARQKMMQGTLSHNMEQTLRELQSAASNASTDYTSYQQMDAHEFLNHLLDRLKEEAMELEKKEMEQQKDTLPTYGISDDENNTEATQDERESVPGNNSNGHSENNSNVHSENNSNVHSENNNSVPTENNSVHSENNNSVHSENNSNGHSENNNSVHSENNNNVHSENNNSVHSENNSNVHHENKSTPTKNNPGEKPTEDVTVTVPPKGRSGHNLEMKSNNGSDSSKEQQSTATNKASGDVGDTEKSATEKAESNAEDQDTSRDDDACTPGVTSKNGPLNPVVANFEFEVVQSRKCIRVLVLYIKRYDAQGNKLDMDINPMRLICLHQHCTDNVVLPLPGNKLDMDINPMRLICLHQHCTDNVVLPLPVSGVRLKEAFENAKHTLNEDEPPCLNVDNSNGKLAAKEDREDGRDLRQHTDREVGSQAASLLDGQTRLSKEDKTQSAGDKKQETLEASDTQRLHSDDYHPLTPDSLEEAALPLSPTSDPREHSVHPPPSEDDQVVLESPEIPAEQGENLGTEPPKDCPKQFEVPPRAETPPLEVENESLAQSPCQSAESSMECSECISEDPPAQISPLNTSHEEMSSAQKMSEDQMLVDAIVRGLKGPQKKAQDLSSNVEEICMDSDEGPESRLLLVDDPSNLSLGRNVQFNVPDQAEGSSSATITLQLDKELSVQKMSEEEELNEAIARSLKDYYSQGTEPSPGEEEEMCVDSEEAAESRRSRHPSKDLTSPLYIKISPCKPRRPSSTPAYPSNEEMSSIQKMSEEQMLNEAIVRSLKDYYGQGTDLPSGEEKMCVDSDEGPESRHLFDDRPPKLIPPPGFPEKPSSESKDILSKQVSVVDELMGNFMCRTLEDNDDRYRPASPCGPGGAARSPPDISLNPPKCDSPPELYPHYEPTLISDGQCWDEAEDVKPQPVPRVDGHYIADVLDMEKLKWYCYNDNNVEEVRNVYRKRSQSGYILFYLNW
ncbi:hypothetical protein ACOMHN_015665 [Nucella lapillus]